MPCDYMLPGCHLTELQTQPATTMNGLLFGARFATIGSQ
jgi:hypothetical protein